MALKKAEFTVPSLAEVSPTYRDLQNRQRDLIQQRGALLRERDQLAEEVKTDLARTLRPGVAALLGEAVTTSKKPRLQELNGRLDDMDAALIVLRDRIRAEHGPASAAACDRIRPEYGRRVAAVCAALEAVETTRAQLEALVDDMEAEEISWTRLTPMQPTFLGDRNDGRVQRYLREAREAGYHNV